MAIFRRRKDTEPDPDQQADDPIDWLQEHTTVSDAPPGDDAPPLTAVRGPSASPASTLEDRLLESLRPAGVARSRPTPTPEPATDDELFAGTPDAEELTETLLSYRLRRPDPATDIARAIRRAVTRALAEDLGDGGDVTAVATVAAATVGRGQLVARGDGIVAGTDLVRETFRQVDERMRVTLEVEDGDAVTAGQVLGHVEGPMRSILTAERTALNLLGHVSGIATATRRFVDAVEGTGAVIRDTRKTTPGLRLLEKMAVVAGGGVNHRLGLFDALLVKDNHNLAAGNVALATSRALGRAGDRPVEVEVASLDELDAAMDAGAVEILLDNFSIDDLRTAVERAPAEIVLEASGGITLDNVADVAATGVQRIAVGALTHSADWLDVALDVTSVEAPPMPAPPVADDQPDIDEFREDVDEEDLFDVAEDDDDAAVDDAAIGFPDEELADDADEVDEPEIAVIGLDDPDPVTFIPASEGRPDGPGPEGFEDETDD